ncbi:aldo/keto reductase [Saccharibacter sp. 17.LH.SD]|nr:aldo/keto reductase [Saccharibacter sp. 17.LH.SD]
MPTITLRNGTTIPRLGMGSWLMGETTSRRTDEIRSLQVGLDNGLRLIDTAEMYGNGRSESVVGEAIRGRRDDAFVVSKVLPHHSRYDDTIEACKRSLRALNTSHLDLYLLHWRGDVPLSETVRAFKALEKEGLILGWGVSNFDVRDMEELERCSQNAVANQILYSLLYRGTEFDLQEHNARHHVATMAYCPIGQGESELLQHPTLVSIAQRHKTHLGPATPAQIALAWTLRSPNIISIPKASTPSHQEQNIAALEITLTQEDLTELDRAFPPPRSKVSLAVI